MKSKTVAIIFFLSAVGMSMWLFEIFEIKGWYSLNWLSGQLYSPFIDALLAVVAFITPLITTKQTSTKNIILPIVILYTVNIICYLVGRQLCYTLYCRYCFWTTKEIALILIIAFILFVFLGVAYWFVTDKFISQNKKINILLITIFTLMTIPLSLFTIRIYSGLGTGSDWVDAVKMGYPVFWIIFVLGLSGIIIARQINYLSKL